MEEGSTTSTGSNDLSVPLMVQTSWTCSG